MKFSELIASLKRGKAGLLSYQIEDDPEIIKAESLEKAKNNELSFLEEASYLKSELSSSNASGLILPNNTDLISTAKNKGIAWASFEEPRIAFAESLNLLNPVKSPKEGIHPTAVIGDNVKIEEGVSIGAHVTIADNCKIGSFSSIYPGVVIYEKVKIGNNNVIHANSVLHRECELGNYCVINSNAVIGSEGFGFIPTKEGWTKMPQTGKVVLEDKVEIGCNSTIDRPSVGETRIGEDTKIDNLVQIGHGVKTGKSCAMAAQVGIAGGASIGNGVILAGQVGVGNRVIVGDRVIATSKCGIHADIEDGKVISGFPAMSNKLWLRCSANFKKLPEFAKAIRDLNRK